MNETILPPSPNWYLSNILTCSKRGTVAWGARNVIVIAKHKEAKDALEYSIINDVYKEKVTTLAFCPKCEANSHELLISGGDNNQVKIWNIDTMNLVTIFSFNDNNPVIGVDWSIKDNKLACAVNSEGFLMSCQTQYETCKIISLGKLAATSLACCPHDSNLVAIGSKNGLVCIINLQKNGSILYKLRGHDTEVISLSWCPSDLNVLNEDPKKDLLLASGAKDRNVFIWRAGGDGRYEIIITLPNQPITTTSITPPQLHKSKLSGSTGIWTAVSWPEPKVLLTTSIWGELLSWDLSTNRSKPTYQLLHAHHIRGLFCIATVPNNEIMNDNWRTDSELTVWTLAQDRWIICCTQKDNVMDIKHRIPTQGGYIYCIAACPFDTSHVAIGAGDMMLRLWNLSEPHTTTFDVTMLWQKIKGKLRSISWHPEKENLLAYGTGEGRVGVFDTNGYNKPPILYRQYHRNTVYKLEWGLMPDYKNYFLFSCAEGELVAYNPVSPSEAPQSILKKNCTEFSWKPDYSCLATASENGLITFYNRDLKKCGNTVYTFKKTVNCLVWHPESTTTDVSLSQMRNYLAVASDSSDIIILDVSDLINSLEESRDINEECTIPKTLQITENVDSSKQGNLHKVVTTLNGHSEKVVCLAWSPHFSGHLVSGSYDHTAQVWNVETQELMATYTGHNGPVLCCIWSPFKPQLIITGSSDFITCIWDYTSPSQSPKEPPNMTSKKKNKHNTRRIPKDKKNQSETRNNSSTSITSIQQSTISADEEKFNTILMKDMPKKKKEKSSYLMKYNKIINEKSYIINHIENEIKKQQEQTSEFQEEENHNIANLSLFSKKEDVLAILTTEKTVHSAEHRHDIVTEMDMWCNNLQHNLECAAKEKRLNDFLVSLSPNLSIKIWKEMCEAYAHQLLLEGNLEKAVSYLLCIHKTYEAIELFLNAKMYKEAYVLAKCKLDVDDPVLTKILQFWAQYAAHCGQIEQAAHCYIKLGDFTKAAETLSRRKDARCLEAASELAFISGNEEYGTYLIKQAIIHAIIETNYTKAHSIITKNSKMQYLEVHVRSHEELVTTYKKDNEYNLVRKWLKGNSDSGILQALGKKYDSAYYSVLQENASNAIPDNEEMIHLYVSYHIAMAVTCDTKEMQLKLIATVLNRVFQYELINVNKEKGFLIHILAKLDAKKPTDEESIYKKNIYPVSKSIRAYLCIGLLDWLLNYLEQLTIEEEVQFTNLIEDLLEDALDRETMHYSFWTIEINQLESRLASLMVDDTEGKEDSMIFVEKINKLKLNKSNFIEKRVSIPDPTKVYYKTHELINILRDDTNKSRFNEAVANIWIKASA